MADESRPADAGDPIRSLIERKLALLLDYVAELGPLVTRAEAGAISNVERRAVERLVQLIVEVCTDVNGVIATATGAHPPTSARESFHAAAREGALPAALAQMFIVSYVGLRNRIVHDYDTLDSALVARAAQRLLADAEEFARQVQRWLRVQVHDGQS